ncbi:Hypothetical predicted protein, partial [Paramuricea clavata]
MGDMAIDSEEECEEEEILLSSLLMRRRRRRLRALISSADTWSRQCIMRRETLEAHSNLIRELNAEKNQQQEKHSMEFWQQKRQYFFFCEFLLGIYNHIGQF